MKQLESLINPCNKHLLNIKERISFVLLFLEKVLGEQLHMLEGDFALWLHREGSDLEPLFSIEQQTKKEKLYFPLEITKQRELGYQFYKYMPAESGNILVADCTNMQGFPCLHNILEQGNKIVAYLDRPSNKWKVRKPNSTWESRLATEEETTYFEGLQLFR